MTPTRSARKRPTASPARARWRPRVEVLEDRTVPTSGWIATTTTTGTPPPGTVGLGYGVGVDNAANVYVTGLYYGTTQFGNVSLTSNGSNDGYVAKLDSDGNFLWAIKLGGAGADYGRAIAVDPATGDAYVTGRFAGTATFGGTTLTSTGNVDAFVLKVDTTGDVKWVRQLGGNDTYSYIYGGEEGLTIALSGSGHVYVGGEFMGTADFGGTILNAASGRGFLSQLSTQGDFVRTLQRSGTVSAVALDAADNLYFQDGAVNRINADGTLAWSRPVGGTLAVDGLGNLTVFSGFAGTAVFGNTTLTATGMEDLYVARLNADGDVQWVRQVGGPGDDRAFGGVTVDAAGNVYASGAFLSEPYDGGLVDFDPGPGTFYLTGRGDYTDFTLKLDGAGEFVWARYGGGSLWIDSDVGGPIYSTDSASSPGLFDTGTALLSVPATRGSTVGKATQDRVAISGRVFNDLDGDGAWGASEPPLSGQTVYLDQDNDGVLDAGEPTAVTDARGLYYFWHAPPGAYAVRQVLAPGWTQTFGSPAYAVAVIAGQAVGDRDFGNTIPSQTITYTSTDVPKSIPSRNWQTASSTLTVADSYPIFGMQVTVSVSSQGSPGLTLIAPDGTRAGLNDLSPFNDKDVRGTWQLELTKGNSSGGKLLGWSMTVRGASEPQIGSLTASPNPVTQGGTFTLTASNVIDRYPNGTITSVSFYRDANGNGLLDPGDVLLGTDTNGGNGWSVAASTTGLAVGSYRYFAVAQDNFGVTSSPAVVSVTVQQKKGKNLLAASTGDGMAVTLLPAGQVDPVWTEAVARLARAGYDVSALGDARVQVMDLPGLTLGMAAGRTIFLDADAAGWGWFVDPTPADDSEFSTPGNQAEQGRMDLLTVVMHEMGHVLGLDHDDSGLMHESLPAGERRLPAREGTPAPGSFSASLLAPQEAVGDPVAPPSAITGKVRARGPGRRHLSRRAILARGRRLAGLP